MGQWSASRSGRFKTDAHWIKGWVCPRDLSGRGGEDKLPAPTGNRTLVQSVDSNFIDWAMPVHQLYSTGRTDSTEVQNTKRQR
jgi:hypothetical protein